MGQDEVNHEIERDNDVNAIIQSDHPRKIVVAGPGTGKTHLFEKQIKRLKKCGRNRILAITFMGKLEGYLADDLAGLAETRTMHSFARWFFLEHCPDEWCFYPKINDIIQKDFEVAGIPYSGISDEDYKSRTKYYKTVGYDDVVYYATQMCLKDRTKIPEYDYILVDEYQDFNKMESEFIDVLASKNEVLIVGDDDQALYGFKESSPEYVRTKFSEGNKDYESHTLRYCSRCTHVIVRAFHDLVKNSNLNDLDNGRVKKIFKCYLPDKEKDSKLNPHLLIKKNAHPNSLDKTIRKELEKMLEEQKISSVLVIGEAKSCKSLLPKIGKRLVKQGFRNVRYPNDVTGLFTFKDHVMEGYRIIDKNPVLGWRLLSIELGDNEHQRYILDNFNNENGIKESLPGTFVKDHLKIAKTFNKIKTKSASQVKQIAESSIEKLRGHIIEEVKPDREVLIEEIHNRTSFLPNPLANIEITVSSILGAKGLGADVVFLVGFDQGKLPANDNPKVSEIYQMLVSLTRAKKRLYLLNTTGKKISQFIELIDCERYIII